MIALNEARIAVIGLGQVGLSLSLAFAARYDVTGFDTDTGLVAALTNGNISPTDVLPP